MGPKGKAEGCLMPESDMTVKKFCWLDVCWGLDVNLCFGLEAGGETSLHIEWKDKLNKRQIQVHRMGARFWLDFADLAWMCRLREALNFSHDSFNST